MFSLRCRRPRGRLRDRKTAVIGAGPAGCAAAYALARQGRRVVLFEAAPEVGGRTRTWRAGGTCVDSGAGFFTNFYPTLWPLLRELDLVDRVEPLSRSNVLSHDGQRAPLTLGSVRSFVQFPFIGWRAKARMAAQTALISVRYRALDLSAPETLIRLDDASIAADAVRRVGEDVYQVIVRAGIEPFWYFSCEDASRALALALHARAATARFYTLRGGMDILSQRLAAEVETRTGVEVAPLGRAGDQVLLRWQHGEEAFDSVVVGTTASAAEVLLSELAGDEVAPETRAFLETQKYVPNIHAAFRVRRSDCPAGISALFPCGPAPKKVAALSFNSHKRQSEDRALGDDELVSVFLTAEESGALLDRPEAALYEICWARARELCPELPVTAEPFQVIARREAIPLHAVGRYRMAARALAAQHGPIVFAGDYLATATVDGALRSGMRAAATLT